MTMTFFSKTSFSGEGEVMNYPIFLAALAMMILSGLGLRGAFRSDARSLNYVLLDRMELYGFYNNFCRLNSSALAPQFGVLLLR